MQYLLNVDNKWTDVTEEHFFRVINLHFDNLKVFETGGKTLYVLKGKQIAQIIGSIQSEAITHKTLIYVSDMQEAKAGKTKKAGE